MEKIFFIRRIVIWLIMKMASNIEPNAMTSDSIIRELLQPQIITSCNGFTELTTYLFYRDSHDLIKGDSFKEALNDSKKIISAKKFFTLKVSSLGFKKNVTLDEIKEKVKSLKIRACPINQIIDITRTPIPMEKNVYIFMDAIKDEIFKLFFLETLDKGLSTISIREKVFRPKDIFIFCC